jgi:hypothetical protein
MKKYLVVTIDTEPDCSSTWAYSDPLTFSGMKIGIGQRLHPLFMNYGVRPTYLINSVVLEHRPSVELLRSLPGEYELGTHLHCEFIEPQKQYYDYAGKKGEANQCFLPPEIEFQKLENITNLFKNCFGKPPVSYRAGRFSAGANTIASLRELGYLVDTSVTPFVNWNDKTREQPIDFSNAPGQPYFVKEGTISGIDVDSDFLEIPLSIIELELGEGKTKAVWLRPYYSSLEDMTLVVNELERKNCDLEVVTFNLMFHNVEVIAGKNRYTQTEEECMNYLRQLEGFFTFCKHRDIEFVTLEKLYEIYSNNRVAIKKFSGKFAFG